LNKIKTIQSTLFKSYSLLITVVLLLFAAFFYNYTSKLLIARTSDSIQRLSGSISRQLEQEVRKMDTISLNIIYSNLVKDHFLRYLEDGIIDEIEKHRSSKILMDIFIAIAGPYQTVQQVNLYDFNNSVIGAGFMNRTMILPLSEQEWYEEVMLLDGRKYISTPYTDAFFVEHSQRNRYFISLYRIYFNKFNERMGIVETALDCRVIFGGMEEILHTASRDIQVYVFNHDGQLIYPIDADLGFSDFYFQNQYEFSGEKNGHSYSLMNPYSGEMEIIAHTYSNYTGWSVFMVQPEREVLLPVAQFTQVALFYTAFLLGLSLIFSYHLSSKFSKPIKKIHEYIQKITFENIGSKQVHALNSNIIEIEDLNSAFQEMSVKLKQSMDNLLATQLQEMKARMTALQSQMNSHFLYNSLANISILAEEENTEPIVKMCRDISFMLRYISSDQSLMVPLHVELDYARRYLECTKLRFGDKITYSIDIPQEMLDLKLPKLLIQPLVENAIKYSAESNPPWHIHLYGHQTLEAWQITIQDSGPGFDANIVSLLNAKISEVNQTGKIPDLEIEGMGLMNVFVRMMLTYQKHRLFKISNHPNGGAMVIIGAEIVK